MLIFKHHNKRLMYTKKGERKEFEVKIKIDGKKLFPSNNVKYLGILIDPHLTWNFHIDDLSRKLSRAIGMLAKIRHYVQIQTLKMIYYGIFSSLLLYGAQIWGQSAMVQQKMEKLQNKALRKMNFKNRLFPVGILYKTCKIMKFSDNIKHLNFLFAFDCIKGNLPLSMYNYMELANLTRSNSTRFQSSNQMNIPLARTTRCGINSIRNRSVNFWNYMNRFYVHKQLIDKNRSWLKTFLKDEILNDYD